MNHRSKALVFDLCQPYAPDGKGKSDDDEYDDWLVYTRIVAYKEEKPCLTEALEDLVTDLCVGLQPAFATDGTLHGAESLYDRYWDVNSPDISPNKLLDQWTAWQEGHHPAATSWASSADPFAPAAFAKPGGACADCAGSFDRGDRG